MQSLIHYGYSIIKVLGAIVTLLTCLKYYKSYRLRFQKQKHQLKLRKEILLKKLTGNIHEQNYFLAEINNLEINSTRFLLVSLSFLSASIAIAQTNEMDTITIVLLSIVILAVGLFLFLAVNSSVQANKNIDILETARKTTEETK